jgi:hypothetical protein
MQTVHKRSADEGERLGLGTGSNLFFSIRNLLLEAVTGDVEEESGVVRGIADRLRRELRLHAMKKREPFTYVAGADAGSQVLPLASRRYAVISALVYSLPSGSRFFLPPESLSSPYNEAGERFRGTVNVRREARLFETACCFIEDRPDVELLLVDGPLAFSNWWSMAGFEPDRQRLVDAVSGLLDACREAGVVVAGVVKRPSARYLIYSIGLQGLTDLPDSFLMLHTLGKGERTDIFSPRSAMRSAVRASHFMDAIGHPVYSFYGRFSGEWSIPPVRVDLPDFSLGCLDDVADYCYGSSFWGGIPLPIVRADEEVRISKSFIGEVYGDILSRVGRGDGEFSHLAPYWGEGAWLGV